MVLWYHFEDPVLTARLRAKLAQYEHRLAQVIDPGTVMRYAILGRLLNNGSVNLERLKQELREKFEREAIDHFSRKAWQNAIDVVSDYAKTGGRNVRGSGLPARV